jgi:hypothetical protein
LQKLIIPGTNIELNDGAIIMLAAYTNTKWIVHNGWYTYGGTTYMGWYLCSIPQQTILPANTSILQGVTIISNNCPCPPVPPCPPPCPPGPFPPDIFWEIDRSWISVETIADRDLLNNRNLPNGKIVRVNDIDENENPGYYIWSARDNTWVPETFGINLSKYLTKAEADALYATTQYVNTAISTMESKVDNIQSAVDNITTNLLWNNLT